MAMSELTITLNDLRRMLAETDAALEFEAAIARDERRFTFEPTLPQVNWRGRLWKPSRGDDD
jgi:hypothetical protein